MSLYREFIIRTPHHSANVAAFISNNAQSMIDKDTPLRVIITTAEQKRNVEQNKRLWKAVYEKIADQAWVGGRQFPAEVWHEMYAEKFMPRTETVTPFGEIISRRMSTSELSVKAFSEYMNKVEADAAQELGVEFGH